jgi:hypothetical protein
LLHASIDVEILHSTAGEELPEDAFFHLLHWACG